MNLNEIENIYRTQIIKYRALVEQGAFTEEEYQELVFSLLDSSNFKRGLFPEDQKDQADKVYQRLLILAQVQTK